MFMDNIKPIKGIQLENDDSIYKIISQAEDVEYNSTDETIKTVQAALENLFARFNKVPTLNYIDEQKIFYFQSGKITLPLNFDTAVSGQATYNVVCKQNELIIQSFSVKNSIGNISLILDEVNNRKGTFTYVVSAIDALNNTSVNSLEFTVHMGGITFYTDFFTTNLNLALVKTEEENYQFNDFHYTYNFVGYENLEKAKLEIYLNNNILLFETPIENSGVNIIKDLSAKLENSGKNTLKFVVTQKIDDKSTLAAEETHEFIVLEQPNSAQFNIINSSFLNKDDVSSDIQSHFITFSLISDTNYNFNANLKIYKIEEENNKTEIISYQYINLKNNSKNTYNFGKLYSGDYLIEINFSTPPEEVNTQNYSQTFSLLQGYNETYIITREDKQILYSYFESEGQSKNQNTWYPLVSGDQDNELKFELIGLNHATNGWMEAENNIQTLKLLGNSYGVLKDSKNQYFNFNNFIVNNKEGTAIEIYFKAENTGDFYSRVITNANEKLSAASIINPPISGGEGEEVVYQTLPTKNGIDISFTHVHSKFGASMQMMGLLENTWNHIVITIDKTARQKNEITSIENYNPLPSLKIYINGILSRVQEYSDFALETVLQPLYLNAYNNNGVMDGFGSCDIKTIRIYNSYLTAQDVYANFLSCLTLEERQIIEEKNKNSEKLPKIFFVSHSEDNKIINKPEDDKADKYYKNSFRDLDEDPTIQSDKSTAKKLRVNSTAYIVYDNRIQKLENTDIQFQGTSTLAYPIKNYKINNYLLPTNLDYGAKEKNRRANFKPINIPEDYPWYADYTYTLKCDYMDQSHKNNTPTAKYYDIVRDYLTTSESKSPPLQVENSIYRDTIDGFACVVYVSDNYQNLLHLDLNDFESALNTLIQESTFKGTYMFNIDKAGNGLGFEFDDKLCISYEGGSNIDYSASTFYPLEFAREQNKDTQENWNDYCDATMEPRYMSSDIKDLDVNIEVENNIEIKKSYLPLYRAIKWLDNFAPLCKENDDNITNQEAIIIQLKKQFREEFKNYFSYEYCLIYYLQALMFTQIDNIGKNAMFDLWLTKNEFENLTLDSTDFPIMYPRPYDMDSQMGLTNFGEDTILPCAEVNPLLSPATDSTDMTHERFTAKGTKTYQITMSRLWIPFALAYQENIKQAYADLRKANIYSFDEIVKYINNETKNKISESYYNQDSAVKYLSALNTTGNSYIEKYRKMLQGDRNNKYQLFLKSRLTFLDSYFDYLVDGKTLNYIELTASGKQVPIAVNSINSIYVKINQDQGAGVIYKFIDEGQTKQLPSIDFTTSAKNAQISPAHSFSSITWPEKIAGIVFNDAINLTELKLTDYTKSFETLDISSLSKLKTLSLEGFSRLSNLIPLTISNKSSTTNNMTSLTNLSLEGLTSHTEGINLKNTNINNIQIKNCLFNSLILQNNMNLTKLVLEKCSNLSSLEIDGSPLLETITIQGDEGLPNLSSITLKNCTSLKEINFSNGVGVIARLELENLPSVTKFIANNSQFNLGKELDLTGIPNLIDLQLTRAQFKNYPILKLNDNTQLETLLINEQCNLSTLYRGEVTPSTKIIDLDTCVSNKTNKLDIQVKGNTQVQYINMNKHIPIYKGFFQNCSQLIGVTGTILIRTPDDTTNLFAGCTQLQNIASIEIQSGVENLQLQYMFNTCKSLQGGIMFENILETLFSKAANTQHMFASCSKFNFTESSALQLGENVTIASNMFIFNTELTCLPTNFFYKCQSNLTDISNLFLGCTKLEELNTPFNTSVEMTNISNIDRVYYDCHQLQIKEAINSFPTMPNCTRAFATFYKVSEKQDSNTIEHVDFSTMQTFFTKISAVEDIDAIFLRTFFNFLTISKQDTNSQVKNIFDNCPNIQTAKAAFYGATGTIALIPDAPLFSKNNTKIKNLSNFFAGKRLVAPNTHSGILTKNFWNTTVQVIGDVKFTLYGSTEFQSSSGIFGGSHNFNGAEYEHDSQYKYLLFDLNLFNGLSVTDFSGTFRNWSSSKNKEIKFVTQIGTAQVITDEITIPNFFGKAGNEFTEGVKLSSCFEGTTIHSFNAESIPSTVTHLDYMFLRCVNLETVTNFNSLFKDKTQLIDTTGMFYNCYKLQQKDLQTETMFQNCTSLQTIAGTFKNCYQLGNGMCELENNTISNKIFKDCPLLTNVNHLFENCHLLDGFIGQEDDDGLFDNNTNIINASRMFNNCYNLRGRIPILFTQNMYIGLQSIAGMFSNCYSLTVKFNQFQNFKYYYTLAEETYSLVPAGWVDNCASLQNISYLFNNVGNYFDSQSQIFNLNSALGSSTPEITEQNPEELLYNYILNRAKTDSILSNINYKPANNSSIQLTIPSSIFNNKNDLTNASYCFYHTNNSSTVYPPKACWDLDQNTISITKLENITGMFANTICNYLGTNNNGSIFTFKDNLGNVIKTKILSAIGTFADSQIQNNSGIFPPASIFLTKANITGIFYNQQGIDSTLLNSTYTQYAQEDPKFSKYINMP